MLTIVSIQTAKLNHISTRIKFLFNYFHGVINFFTNKLTPDPNDNPRQTP